jgi:hypothetical protein
MLYLLKLKNIAWLTLFGLVFDKFEKQKKNN